MHQREGLGGHSALLRDLRERLQVLHRFGEQHRWIIYACFIHGLVSCHKVFGLFRHYHDEAKRGNVTSNQDWLAEKFEENRGRLKGVAYRMLGLGR